MQAVKGVNELEWMRIPLLVQEGWTRHQTLEEARTGWSFWIDHPVCAFKGLRDIFLMRSHPSVPGGEYALTYYVQEDGVP